MFSTKIAAVAFDMDGLLLNTEDLYGEVGQILLERRGKSYREEVRQRMIGLPAPQAFGILIEAEDLKESWQELQRETDEVFEDLLPTRLALMPGVEELLKHVDTLGMPRCVATSSTRNFATKVLTQMGVFHRFDFLVTAADVPRGKPYPDIYLEAARRMGVTVSEMLVLEDSQTGTKAGVSANAYVVSVPNQHTQHGNFEGARWIAHGLIDKRLRELLSNHAREI